MQDRAVLHGRVVLGTLGLLALTAGLSGGPAGAAGTQGPAHQEATFSGEQGRDVGPRSAPVDPSHATPAAARAKVLATHQHDHGDASEPTASATAAAADLAPSTFGQWSTLAYNLPVRAIHVTLLRTGKFLLIAGSGNNAKEQVIGNFRAYLWDPDTGSLTSVPVPYDAFCSGHLVDANGDVIVLGGTVRYRDANGPWTGSRKAYKFVVATSSWVAMPPMRRGRWYPTSLLGARGRFFAFSGKDGTGATPATHERYNPATRTWSPVLAGKLPLYPGLHLLKDGRIAYTGAHYARTYATSPPRIFNPVTGSQVRVRDPNGVMNLGRRNSAMSALVGSADKQLAWVAGGGFPVVRSTYFVDFSARSPVAVAGPHLAAPKAYVSVSHLPDLTALETGGGAGTDSPVFEASILNPNTRRLTSVAPPAVPRTYHSSSITMPDGRVVTFGGDPSGDGRFELRVEIFSPPYLFQGPRPTVTSWPTEVRYGAGYTVQAEASGATLRSAVIMRPGSATHAVDANQRVLQLATTGAAGGLGIQMPTNRNLAPPGWYLLFLNDSLGRPSVGRWIHLG